MAGTKKKRKPVQNPLRGFQTSSQPSKNKVSLQSSDTLSTQELNDDQDHYDTVFDKGEDTRPQQIEASSEAQDMTPEQLEEHLERSELQAALSAHGHKAKLDASRAATRLQTDRRVLRSQTPFLDTREWLPIEIRDEVLNIAKGEDFVQSLALSKVPKRPFEHLTPEMDMCVRLWKVYRTLTELGLPDLPAALQGVLSSVSGHNEFSTRSKESIWGVDEALIYLAVHSNDDPRFTYDFRPSFNATKATSLQSNGLCDTAPKANAVYEQKSEPQPFVEGNGVLGQEGEGAEKDAGNDTTSSTEEDIDPEVLQDRFIDVKTKLFEIEYSLAAPETCQQAKTQRKQKNHLEKVLSKIQRDVLFDPEALNVWRSREVDLRKSLSQKETYSSPYQPNDRQKSDSKPLESGMNRSDDSGSFDEEDSILGSLFESEGPLSNVSGCSQASPPGNDDVLLQDFGKVVGSPKRILEDACKAIDSGCRIALNLVSQAAHSNRHRLRISWAKDQTQFLSCDFKPPRVSFLTTARSVEACMESIATSTVAQSEAYISVVVLFCLFSESFKGDRPYLRLPTTWRSVWDNLSVSKQEMIDVKDMTILKEILDITRQSGTMTGPDEDVSVAKPMRRTERTASKGLKDHTSLSMLDGATFWRHKSSTPAYQRMLQSRQTLPIWQSKSQILQAVKDHQVTIISGETGSGKSTQVPSFLFEHDMLARQECRILVTEPRRISAMSLARRVSEELGEGISAVGSSNSLVGYAIRLESRVSLSTRITFATNGVVMRMLENPNAFHDLRYIVLDEVHERAIDTDFLLIVLRRLLPDRPHLRLILMSATFDAEKFAEYFSRSGSIPPILKIPGRTFPVETKYLEDVIEMTRYKPGGQPANTHADNDAVNNATSDYEEDEMAKSTAAGLEGYSVQTRTTLSVYDEYRIDYFLITKAIAFVANDTKLQRYSKAFLVFLPGIAEIRRLQQIIESDFTFEHNWVVFVLHSSIAGEDQEQAFVQLSAGVRKIVLSTNIAETGVTIPDITTIIDTGKEKVMRFDERRQMSRLTESFISKASSKQRQGRAARVQPGLALKMYTRDRHDRLMSDQTAPEMVRLSLQDPVLRVKLYGMGGIEETLSQALAPPTTKNVGRAIDALREVKALTASEELTPLGRQLARLPLDIWLGKMILMSIAFRCVDCAITIAATLTSKSPFLDLTRTDLTVTNTRETFKRGDSDLLLSYNAYLAWKRATEAGKAREFLSKNRSLSGQALSTIEDQKAQLFVSLVDAGILHLEEAEKSSLKRARIFTRNRHFFTTPLRYNINGQNDVVISTTIASAFYPKLLAREGKGWKNIARNQSVSLSPQSILRNASPLPRFVSFYQTAQSKSKNVLAYDLTPVNDFAVALFLGDAEFKLYAGVIAIDGSRIRFAVKDLQTMVALLVLRTRIQAVIMQGIQFPRRPLSDRQKKWVELWQRLMEGWWKPNGG